MVQDFMMFNVFGVIRAERTHVHIMATGVLPGGRSIEKTSSVDLPDPIAEIELSDTAVILFAANVNADGKKKVATQNISARAGGPDLTNNKVIKKLLMEVLKKFD
jgi:hypothetical protein